jgi:hypothetical protein
MGILSLTCKQASRLQSQALDRDLGLGERLALRWHLGICEACTRVSRQWDFLRRATKAYPGPDDNSPR